MSAISSIVINDGMGVPVAHTFAPAKASDDFAQFEDRVSGIYVGYNKLTLSLQRPKGPANVSNRNLKGSIKIETPKMETTSNNTIAGIAPAPTISYRPVVELNVTFPDRCNLQDRKDLLAYIKNVLSNAHVVTFFENYELPY